MPNVVINLLLPECHVCGRRMESKFLQPFPGAHDINACPHCIADCTRETPSVVSITENISKGRGPHDQN